MKKYHLHFINPYWPQLFLQFNTLKKSGTYLDRHEMSLNVMFGNSYNLISLLRLICNVNISTLTISMISLLGKSTHPNPQISTKSAFYRYLLDVGHLESFTETTISNLDPLT